VPVRRANRPRPDVHEHALSRFWRGRGCRAWPVLWMAGNPVMAGPAQAGDGSGFSAPAGAAPPLRGPRSQTGARLTARGLAGVSDDLDAG
jgi:hypothetical protein